MLSKLTKLALFLTALARVGWVNPVYPRGTIFNPATIPDFSYQRRG